MLILLTRKTIFELRIQERPVQFLNSQCRQTDDSHRKQILCKRLTISIKQFQDSVVDTESKITKFFIAKGEKVQILLGKLLFARGTITS